MSLKKNLFILTILIFILTLSFILLKNVDTFLIYQSSTIPNSVDAVVVLGGGTGSRVDKALRVFNEHNANYMIMSSGPYFYTTSSKIMGEYAIRNGLKPDVVLYEENSYSTKDHVYNLDPIFQQKNIRTAIIVTEYFHTARTHSLFSDYYNSSKSSKKINLFIVAADDGINYKNWYKDHESIQKIGIELIKRVYYKLFVSVYQEF